jgi:hypothetical protein
MECITRTYGYNGNNKKDIPYCYSVDDNYYCEVRLTHDSPYCKSYSVNNKSYCSGTSHSYYMSSHQNNIYTSNLVNLTKNCSISDDSVNLTKNCSTNEYAAWHDNSFIGLSAHTEDDITHKNNLKEIISSTSYLEDIDWVLI